MSKIIHGRTIVPGTAQGTLLVSTEPLSFWGGYDQHTGTIIDRRHPLAGQAAGGKILALPFSRGSSTTTAVLLEAVKAGTSPAAILTTAPDSFFALASIVADEMYGRPIPLVTIDQADLVRLTSGTEAVVYPDGRVAW